MKRDQVLEQILKKWRKYETPDNLPPPGAPFNISSGGQQIILRTMRKQAKTIKGDWSMT